MSNIHILYTYLYEQSSKTGRKEKITCLQGSQAFRYHFYHPGPDLDILE